MQPLHWVQLSSSRTSISSLDFCGNGVNPYQLFASILNWDGKAHSIEIKPLKSSPTFRTNRAIRRRQPSRYAPSKARCNLAKVPHYHDQSGRWWGEPRIAFVPPSSFERLDWHSASFERLQRVWDGAWWKRSSRRRIVRFNRNAGADSRNFDLQEVRLVNAIKMQNSTSAVFESPQKNNLVQCVLSYSVWLT